MSLADRNLEVVKDRLLTDTHLGRLRAERRAPSVRRMAQLTGLDRKTVHRAYSKLVAEGLLRTRPGCGTFISEEPAAGLGPVPAAEVLGAVTRCLADAAALGFSPRTSGQILAILVGDGLRGCPVAIVECDHEQIGLIAREVHDATGAAVYPLLLRDVQIDPGHVLRHVHAVVGTSCHRDEVLALAAPFRLPVHWVVQDPNAAASFLPRARRGRVLMIVHDTHCASGLRRLLRELRTPEETIERFEFVTPPDATPHLQQLADTDSVYISPLVALDRIAPLPPPRQRIPPPPYLDRPSLDQLRVRLTMDIVGERASRRVAGGGRSVADRRTVPVGRESVPGHVVGCRLPLSTGKGGTTMSQLAAQAAERARRTGWIVAFCCAALSVAPSSYAGADRSKSHGAATSVPSQTYLYRRPPLHPAGRRCSSSAYGGSTPSSSRLALRALRRPLL